MPRRIKPKETKRDWRWWANTLLNSAVVLSMVLGTVFVFAGVPSQSALPTMEVPTVAPATPAPSATPTPKASVDQTIAAVKLFHDGDVIYGITRS